MSEKNMKSAESAESSKAAAKAAAKAAVSRRESEIAMVNAIGAQLNQMVSTICRSAVKGRKIDFEGLESKDRAEVLKSEGTTLVALSKSADETFARLWEASAPGVAAFAAQAMQARLIEANARLIEAQTAAKQAEVEERLAEIREQELEIKRQNAATERRKAEAAYTNGIA
jgi:hypothetical protein